MHGDQMRGVGITITIMTTIQAAMVLILVEWEVMDSAILSMAIIATKLKLAIVVRP
jgi:hypothetical protein